MWKFRTFDLREADVINSVMGYNSDDKSVNSDGIPQVSCVGLGVGPL